MTIVSWEELVEGRSSPASRGQIVQLTVGVFDGLHVGHRRLLAAVGRGPEDALSLVLTFRRKSEAQGLILTVPQKLRRMAALGVGAAVLIDFSNDFSTLSPGAFIELLRGRLAIGKITVGPNFRFGRNRDADVRALGQMLAGTSTRLEVVEPALHRGEIVSSSRIRAAIRDGEMADAREMLGTPHEIDLSVLWPDPGQVAPVLPNEEGTLRVERRLIPQVLPVSGRFAVVGRWAGGGAAGELAIGEKWLELRLEREAPVSAIEFMS